MFDNRKVGAMIVGNIKFARDGLTTAEHSAMVTGNIEFKPTLEQLVTIIVRGTMDSQSTHQKFFDTSRQAVQHHILPLQNQLTRLLELFRSLETAILPILKRGSRYNTLLSTPAGKGSRGKCSRISARDSSAATSQITTI